RRDRSASAERFRPSIGRLDCLITFAWNIRLPSTNPAQVSKPADQTVNMATWSRLRFIARARAVLRSMPGAARAGTPPPGVVAGGFIEPPGGTRALRGRAPAPPIRAQLKRPVGLLQTGGTIDLTTTSIQSA